MPELTPEQRASQQIDAQLAACGWLVQDYKQFNPSAGCGIALREAPLKSGTCDYLLAEGVNLRRNAGSGDPAYRSALAGQAPTRGLWPRDDVEVCSTAW